MLATMIGRIGRGRAGRRSVLSQAKQSSACSFVALIGIYACSILGRPTNIIVQLRVLDTPFVGGAVAAWPLAAHPQQLARYRIGHLAIAAPTDTPPPPLAKWDAFVQGLREIGYTEGQNITFEHRSAHV